jgi:replication factor C subunit 3/5
MNNPIYLHDFIIHKNIASSLSYFNNDIPHMIFYGPNSSGKKSLLYAFINKIYNNSISIQKYRTIKYDDITVNNNAIPIQYVQSPYHYEFNLSEYGLCDRDVITNYIKKIIEYKTVDKHFRIIILHHIDRISKDTQIILLNLMDKYIETSRFFCTCENFNYLHSSIISRVYHIRIPYASPNVLISAIKFNIPQLNDCQIIKIIEQSNYKLFNINQYLFFIKNAITSNPNSILTDTKLNEILSIDKPLNIIDNLLPHIIIRNVSSIKNIRTILYDYLLGNVSIKDILKEIVSYILSHPSIPNNSKQSFLYDINNNFSNIDNIEYNIIIIEFLILKVKKLLLLNNVS